jgi:hypothetical protein
MNHPAGTNIPRNMRCACGDCPGYTPRLSADVNAHTLTLEFGRFLSEAEWRDIVDRANRLPYVKHLHANAVWDDNAIADVQAATPTVSETD